VANSRGFRSGLRVPRRRKSWDVGIGQTGVQANISSSSAVIVSSALAVLQDGITLLRLRGEANFMISSVAAALDGFSGAFGIGVATTAAVTAGAASVPTPLTEAAWDGWIFWQAMNMKSLTGTLSDFGVNTTLRMPIDTKAMRKLSEDESIYGVIETNEVGTSNLVWHVDSRVLIALP